MLNGLTRFDKRFEIEKIAQYLFHILRKMDGQDHCLYVFKSNSSLPETAFQTLADLSANADINFLALGGEN